MSSDDHPDRARTPADVGPTDHRLTTGIEADVGESSGDADGTGSGESEPTASTATGESGAVTPKWASSIRNVLAGVVFVLVGTYLAMGQPDPHGGLARIVVFVGLVVGLYGFVTWPPSRNVR